AIAALMARMIDRPLQTFSVAFKERAFNELAYAREVARAIHADAHEVVIDDADFFGALPKLVWHEDEPIAHPSSVPLYFVSALARNNVTVVLTGEGSDELLAGYGKYPRIAWNWRAGTVYERMVPRALREKIARNLPPMLSPRLARYATRSFLAKDRTPESMLFDNFAAIPLAHQQELLHRSLRGGATPTRAYAASVEYFDRPNGRSTFLDRVLYADIKTYLVELLMKQDQMSMAASIESRVPFLDHVLVEFAATIPAEFSVQGLTGKHILKAAVEDLLPKSIVYRKKMGVATPWSCWLSGPQLDELETTLLGPRTTARGLLRREVIQRLFAEHRARRRDHG